MNISIFYAPGSAGNVRGKQVAEMLGAKQNPTKGFEKDTCIYVKVIPPKDHPEKTYYDIDDALEGLKYLKSKPGVGVIATSELQKEYLIQELDLDYIYVIPHIHPNYENWRRPEREIKTVGIIGSKTSMMYPVDKVKKALAEKGLDLIYHRDYWKEYGDQEGMSEDERRKRVCEFYKSIDIQIIWSKGAFTDKVERMKNPNKIINAGAFGIPTVSYPNLHFTREFKNWFVEAESIEQLIKRTVILKNNPEIYNQMSDELFRHCTQFHREVIRQLYLILCESQSRDGEALSALL